MSSRVSSQNNLAPQSTFSRGKSPVLAEGWISEETNNSVFEYYSNNIRIITIRIRIRPFF